MSLDSFKDTEKGALIGTILARPDALRKMENLSRANRPAVEAIGADIASAVGNLDHDERKMVGRWVRELLARRGLVPDRKGRVARGHLFTRGTIYRAASPAASSPNAQERLEAARAIIKRLPHRPMSADELIAERRREAAGER
jgi:hypothetical protein